MYKMKGFKIFGLAFALIFLLGFSWGAWSQEKNRTNEQQGIMPQETPEVDLSETELDRVAQAYKQVIKIRKEFQEELRDIKSPEKANQMQQEANQAMVEAVQAQGLQLETYNQVMEAAQFNEDLRDQLLDRLDEEYAVEPY